MIKIFIFMVIAILTGIWLSNYIMTKIQVSLNLPIMIPMKHKMLLSRNIIKIENATLFKVREKRGLSILKIIPFLRHSFKEREYYIKPAFVVPYEKSLLKYQKACGRSKIFEILLDDSYRVISKCNGIETHIINNEKTPVETHIIYYMKKGKMEGMKDFIKECAKTGVYQIEEPSGFMGLSGREYYNDMKNFTGGGK